MEPQFATAAGIEHGPAEVARKADEVEARVGDDTLDISDCEFDNDVFVDMGKDDDHVIIDDNDFNGDVDISGGGGHDDISGRSGNSFRDVPATEIPTLVMAGELDPVTPAEQAAATAEQLGDAATYIEFPGIGHGATPSSECGIEVFRSFLADPGAAPDTTCVDEMTGPAWATS